MFTAVIHWWHPFLVQWVPFCSSHGDTVSSILHFVLAVHLVCTIKKIRGSYCSPHCQLHSIMLLGLQTWNPWSIYPFQCWCYCSLTGCWCGSLQVGAGGQSTNLDSKVKVTLFCSYTGSKPSNMCKPSQLLGFKTHLAIAVQVFWSGGPVTVFLDLMEPTLFCSYQKVV
jgi:hypothetical protein